MIIALNLGSFVLGLIAWILPVVNLTRYSKYDFRKSALLSVVSLSACAISLCLQLFQHDRLVKTENWSALMDTTGAVAFAAAVLLVVTILLNAVALLANRPGTAR